MHGRIWFEGNPWPEGHAIVDFAFQVLLDEGGPRLLLHLRSEDYDAHDDPDAGNDETGSDWLAKGVWGNYHRCTLSNLHWGVTPQSAPLLKTPVSVKPTAIALKADPIAFGKTSQRDPDDHAFHIYLLGHDSVHDHDIRIRRGFNGLYEVGWSGLIALTYAGDDVFRHRFRAEVHNAEFGGFRIENPNPAADTRVFVHPKPQPPTRKAREARARALAARMVRGDEILDFHPGKGFNPDLLKPRA